MKKKLIYLLFLILLLLPLPLKAVVPMSQDKYVTDDANVLTEDAKAYIVKYSDFLYKSRKIDFYVVTVKNMGTDTIEEYTDEIFNTYHISEKGLLIVTSKEDRKMRVQAGTELSKILDSDLIEKYINKYFIPYLEREEWNDGIINGYSAFYKYICEKYQIDASSMEVVDKLDFITKYKTPLSLLVIWLCVIFANIFTKFFKKVKKEKNTPVSAGEIIKIGVFMLINIAVLSLSYLLEPIYVILGILFEGITMYSSLATTKEKNKIKPRKQEKENRIKKERKPRIIKKRRKY